MNRWPLRLTMFVPMLAIVAIGVATFSVYLDQVQHQNFLADLDDELVRAERSFAARIEAAGGLQPTPLSELGGDAVGVSGSGVESPVQLMLGPDGEILVELGAPNPFGNSDLAGRRGVFTVEDPRFRVRVSKRDDGMLAVSALSFDRFDQSVADFRWTMAVGGLVLLTLQGALAAYLTARLARPVTRMASAATLIADGDMNVDIDSSSGSLELAELADNLNRMVDQLRSTIEDRESSAEDAREARDDMRRFLADVSHEFRTPLTALKGYSDLYAGSMLEEPGALDRAMTRIGDESGRLYELVNDMLQLARQAPLSDQAERVALRDVVSVVVDDLRAAHADLPIDLDIAGATEMVVMGWPGQLHQALLNVGSNACNHTEPDHGVQVRVESTSSEVVIDVVDHGPGVDPEEVDKIFLPFYRRENSRNRDGRGGAGLGLAITTQIIERHAGTIAISTTPRGGATFTLTVPLARTHPALVGGDRTDR